MSLPSGKIQKESQFIETNLWQFAKLAFLIPVNLKWETYQ